MAANGRFCRATIGGLVGKINYFLKHIDQSFFALHCRAKAVQALFKRGKTGERGARWRAHTVSFWRMARDTTDDTPLSSKDELVNLPCGTAVSRPENSFRIGTEHEKIRFLYRRQTRRFPTKARNPSAHIAEAGNARTCSVGKPILDEGKHHRGPGRADRENGAISLEPGGTVSNCQAPAVDKHSPDLSRIECPIWHSCARLPKPLGIGFPRVSAAVPKWDTRGKNARACRKQRLRTS